MLKLQQLRIVVKCMMRQKNTLGTLKKGRYFFAEIYGLAVQYYFSFHWKRQNNQIACLWHRGVITQYILV